MRFAFLFFATALLCSCAARPKIYSAPDASKVNAAAKRLAVAISETSARAIHAEEKVVAAKKSFDLVAAESVSVRSKIAELKKILPAEYQPHIAELEGAANRQQAEEGNLSTYLSGAQSELSTLKQENLPEVDAARDELREATEKYQLDSVALANNATRESSEKVAFQNQLQSEKRRRLLWRILGGGSVLLVVGVVVVLLVTGKISIAAIRAYFRI